MLNASGQISIGGSTVGQSINLQLGRTATATSNLNESLVRTLANVTIVNTQISLSNFYSKPLYGRMWKYTDLGANGSDLISYAYDMDVTANGQVLILGGGSQLIRSVDYGETFSYIPGSPSGGISYLWNCVSVSSNGSIILAALGFGADDFLYLSKNGGVSFATTGPATRYRWQRVEVSDDGFRMFAYSTNNVIYTTSNMGANWTSRTSPVATGTFTHSAASSNTQYIMLCTFFYPIANTYISTNYGNTWTKKAVVNPNGFELGPDGVTMSANGMVMYIATDSGYLFKSTDFGSTFSIKTYFGAQATEPSCDATGKKIIVGNSNGSDYIMVSEDGLTSNAVIQVGGNISGGMDGGVHVSSDGNTAYILGIYGDFYKALL